MRITLLMSLSVLVGCAGGAHQKFQVATESSLFNGESLLRISQSGENCYKEDLQATTKRARENYAKGAKSAQYWSELGNCLAWHNELRESRFFLGLAQDLAKTKEEQALVKNNIAVVYLRQGRVTRAFELFKEARELAPRFVTPSFNLAQMYVSHNLNQDALKVLSDRPFIGVQDAEVSHLRGLAHLQMGKVKEAAPHLAAISPSLYKRADVAVTFAKWHVLEQRPDEAMSFLENRQAGISPSSDRLAERLESEAKVQIVARELAQEAAARSNLSKTAERLPAQDLRPEEK